MGDRIAILREGGVLAQYDTPDAILAQPADEFVAKFIGEDRALRRLALKRLSDVQLGPADGAESGVRVSIETTVRNAVSLLLDTKTDRLLVENDKGEIVGAFRFSDAGALL
jgi:osmoprotectant transport system ATP-binding protein